MPARGRGARGCRACWRASAEGKRIAPPRLVLVRRQGRVPEPLVSTELGERGLAAVLTRLARELAVAVVRGGEGGGAAAALDVELLAGFGFAGLEAEVRRDVARGHLLQLSGSGSP